MNQSNQIWRCEYCKIEFDEDQAATIDVSPDSDERMTACPKCYANPMDDHEMLRLLPPVRTVLDHGKRKVRPFTKNKYAIAKTRPR